MVLCDLPYGTTQNKWDSIVPLDELWAEYKRIVKPNGAIVLTSQGLFTALLIMSQPKLFKYKWVWEKSKPTNFLNAKKQPLRKHEDVCVFYRKQPVYNPQMTEGEPYDKGVRKNQLSGSYGDFQPVHVHSDGKRYPIDVVYFKTAESEGEVFHATQKPVEMGRYFVRNGYGKRKGGLEMVKINMQKPEVPVIIIERDEPLQSEAKATPLVVPSRKRKWLNRLLTALAAAGIMAAVLWGFYLWNYYYNIGVPVSFSRRKET